jgi:hypothetical protein
LNEVEKCDRDRAGAGHLGKAHCAAATATDREVADVRPAIRARPELSRVAEVTNMRVLRGCGERSAKVSPPCRRAASTGQALWAPTVLTMLAVGILPFGCDNDSTIRFTR